MLNREIGKIGNYDNEVTKGERLHGRNREKWDWDQENEAIVKMMWNLKMDPTNCERWIWEGEVPWLCVWCNEYFKENASGKEYLSHILLIHNFLCRFDALLSYYYKKKKKSK